MPKPATLATESASIATATATAERPSIPEDEAKRTAQVLGELLSVCRNARDSTLAEEQPIGTFRVGETGPRTPIEAEAQPD